MMEKDIKLPRDYGYISAFLTMRCNLNCIYCVNKTSDKNFQRKAFTEMSGKDWVRALNKINSNYGVPVSFLGGEPSLHEDFIYIINNLKPELGIDILTNLWWNKNKLNKFIKEVSPKRINKDSPFPSIRISYHPEQMGEGEKLIENAVELKKAGFNVGIEAVMHPIPFQLESLEQMAIRCKTTEISFRPKSFIGVYEGEDDVKRPFSITYGNYSKYPGAVFNEKTLECMCKTSSLLINPCGEVYRCQRDLLLNENAIGNLLDPNFQIKNDFLPCNNYGQCHPCDVKVTTDYKQKLGRTDVEIKF